MSFVRIGRALASLPAEILIPIMIVLIIISGIFYAKGMVPKSLGFHSLVAIFLFFFAGYVLYLLELPQIISNILMILGVVSIVVSFCAFAHDIYHNESVKKRKAKAFFLIFTAVYCVFLLIFICFF